MEEFVMQGEVTETNDCEEIELLVKRQQDFFRQGTTLPLEFRRKQLETLGEAIGLYENRILKALEADLGKSHFEGYETEIGMVKAELRHTLRHLSSWAKVRNVKTPVVHFPAKSVVYREPLGVNLVLSPWNYPFQLSIAPLIASMAGGNTTIIKPSRNAPNTAACIESLVKQFFDPEYISVLTGSQQCNDSLLQQRFDHIFFTGSLRVGRIVMKAASENLTPVTLELGGKSPCIVDETASVDLAARRIVWGKTLNSGQTCVAPDFVLVHSSKKEALIQAMEKYITAFYGSEPLSSKDLSRIVNEKHFQRLKALMEYGVIRFGGKVDSDARKIEPTILTEVNLESPLMNEEIFGPLLPVLEYTNLKDVVQALKEREKPLSLYFFSNSKKRQEMIMEQLSFGGGCINDTIVHLANPHLAFGGVGQSGMGAYHGKRGFETFTHEKSILKKSNWLDIPLRYPPYTGKLNLLKKLMK